MFMLARRALFLFRRRFIVSSYFFQVILVSEEPQTPILFAPERKITTILLEVLTFLIPQRK